MSDENTTPDLAPEYIDDDVEVPVELSDFALTEDDAALLSDDTIVDRARYERKLPVVAVIGRPNVGKSTLVNRIIGRRAAVVENTPGVTRDRVRYPAEWNGTDFILMDTGGWESKTTGIDKNVAQQSEYAIASSDVVIFVVDAMVGATATDEQLLKIIRRSRKPVVLAANKVDDPKHEVEVAALWNLGLDQPYPVSAIHGVGTGDMLDRMVELFPKEDKLVGQRVDSRRRIALVGRPNVGKSSLLNQLAGEERVVVHDVAGTTRDPVDEIIELDEREWVFVDTAGIRRRVHQTRGADFYASLRTQQSIDKAELAAILLDASETLTDQDMKVIQLARESGRAMVFVFNKWDQVDDERRYYLEKEIDRELVQYPWVPRVNLSALTGWHTNRLVRAFDTALEGWSQRVTTGKLNGFLAELVAAHPHPMRGGRQPRILFATQADTSPPRFVIFATGFLEAQYRRFIERRLRETFGFEGTPIELSVRIRQRRGRK